MITKNGLLTWVDKLFTCCNAKVHLANKATLPGPDQCNFRYKN